MLLPDRGEHKKITGSGYLLIPRIGNPENLARFPESGTRIRDSQNREPGSGIPTIGNPENPERFPQSGTRIRVPKIENPQNPENPERFPQSGTLIGEM